jgi:hypothetical protein
MKVLGWLLFAIGCIYVFYTGAMTVWSYLEITGVVEEVVAERATRVERPERAARVKEDITRKMAASGIRVDDRGVSVADEGRTLDISVRWSVPVNVPGYQEVFAIPLKHERSFNVPERR